jgi:competence transcription factor ComK
MMDELEDRKDAGTLKFLDILRAFPYSDLKISRIIARSCRTGEERLLGRKKEEHI